MICRSNLQSSPSPPSSPHIKTTIFKQGEKTHYGINMDAKVNVLSTYRIYMYVCLILRRTSLTQLTYKRSDSEIIFTPMLAVHDTSPASFSALHIISPICFSGVKLLMTSIDVLCVVTIVISSLSFISSPLMNQVSVGRGSPVKTTCKTSSF